MGGVEQESSLEISLPSTHINYSSKILYLEMNSMSVSNAHSARFHWHDLAVWKTASQNTSWCLLGCTIGDFGTIFFFQWTQIPFPSVAILTLAIVNGLLTSIALETFILYRQMSSLMLAFQTAIKMSFIAMVAMESAMNVTDYLLVGEARLTWWSVPPMLVAGFLTPLPYSYWRLKAFGIACH